MNNFTKNILIVLASLAFLTIGTLLIIKIGNIGRTRAYSYGADGCPVDGQKWTYNKNTGMCTTSVNTYYNPCQNDYKYHYVSSKCYKSAVRAASDYICANSTDTFYKNFPGIGSYVCIRNPISGYRKKLCPVGTPTSDGIHCQVKAINLAIYTVTYNANGGYAKNKSGNKYYSWTDTKKAALNEKYKFYDNFYKRDGYVFTGWNDKADGTGKKWPVGTFVWERTNNLTLYAQWKKITVPDVEFNKCVATSYSKEKGYTWPNNEQLSSSQLATIKTLTCNNSNVKDVTGLEKMTGLTTLTLSSNNIFKSSSKNLDLSKNTKLKYLTIGYAKYVTELDLSKNTALLKLSISNSDIEKITGLEKLKKLYSISFYNLPKLGYYSSGAPKYSTLMNMKFLTIHRTPYVQGYSDVYNIEGPLSGFASGDTAQKKEYDIFDVYQKSATLTGKNPQIVFVVNSKASGAKITSVEYKKGNSWSGLSKKNVTYSEAQTVVKFTKSQTVTLRVKTNDGVVRVFKNYNIKVN